MFLVNKHPATVLFDSGASLSFMSQAFASKYDQKIIEVNKGGYSISSARATISTNQIVKDVLISIQEREYIVDLIVLPGLAIDVILGMSWMSDHGVLIDTSTRTIMLRERKGEGVFLVPLPRSFYLQNDDDEEYTKEDLMDMCEQVHTCFEMKRKECKELCKKIKSLEQSFDELNASHESLRKTVRCWTKLTLSLKRLTPLSSSKSRRKK